MRTYLIVGLKEAAVYAYADAAAANRAAESRFPGDTTVVASNEGDLAAHTGPALVRLYNQLIGEGAAPVARFATRGDGARRVWEVLSSKFSGNAVEPEAANAAARTEAANEEGDGGMKKVKKARAKAARAPRTEGKKSAGAPAIVREDSSRGKLLRIAVENPGISVAQLANRAGVSKEGVTEAATRVRLRLRAVAEKIGGAIVEFGEKGASVNFSLPKGTTLDKVFGR